MRIGGRWGARPAAAAVRQRALRSREGAGIRRSRDHSPGIRRSGQWARLPTLHGRVPPVRSQVAPVRAAIYPVAAVSPTVPDPSGSGRRRHRPRPRRPSTSPRPLCRRHRRPMIVNAPGALGIPIDRTGRIPQRRTEDGRRRAGLRRQLEPARRDRAHRVGPRGWRGRRRARHRGRPDLRPLAGRHAARQRGHPPEQRRQSRHLRARDGADAVPARHLGALRRPTARATARPIRRTCSTPRWRPPGTCAAVGSTCATRRRSCPRSCATTTRWPTRRTCWAGPRRTPPAWSRSTCRR